MPTALPSRMDFVTAADLLSAMANDKRMLILEIISRGEVSVGSLAVMVNLSQSALSQHLGKLRGARLVQTRRDAQTVYYRTESDSVRLVLATLHDIFAPKAVLAAN